MATTTCIKSGHLTRQSLSGVWVKNLLWRWKVFCVLTNDNRLEIYNNSRSHERGLPPRHFVDLSTTICVCSAELVCK